MHRSDKRMFTILSIGLSTVFTSHISFIPLISSKFRHISGICSYADNIRLNSQTDSDNFAGDHTIRMTSEEQIDCASQAPGADEPPGLAVGHCGCRPRDS
jgi:hypothetical protein